MCFELSKVFERKYLRQYDIRFIMPIYKIASITGFAPFYDFESQELTKNCSSVYPLVMLTLRTMGYIYLIYKLHAMYMVTGISFVLNVLSNAMMVLLGITATLQVAIFRKKQLSSLFDSFRKVDSLVDIYNKASSDTFVLEILTANFAFSIILCADILLKSSSVGEYLYLVVGGVVFAMNEFFLYMMCNFALAIRSRFEHLNEAILRIPATGVLMLTARCMKAHALFAHLNATVSHFNYVFGWSVLMFIVTVFVGFLQCFSNLITAGAPEALLVDNFVAIATLVMVGFILITCFHVTNKEIKRTLSVCFQSMPALSENPIGAKYLGYIISQASCECPQLSAAEIFPVNLSTLFSMAGSLTSYVIILLQFNNDES